MVNGVPGSLRTGPQASQTFWETARELLCRNRHLFGTLKRVHCRRNRRDREGSEGGEPPRRTREVLQSLWPSLDCNRPRGGPAVAMALRGLTGAGFLTSLMETRHVNAALSTVKTDRRDARGIAQLLRMGWFRPVHAKSAGSQELRALLVARKQLQHKFRDVELSLRGILRGFGLKVGKVTDKTYEARIRELVTARPMFEQIAESMLAARAALLEQFKKLHKSVLKIVRQDEVCRRFMTTPSVGAIVAITYKSALDVESPGELSPPGAPKTVHDPLESHGSRCSAV